MGRPRLHDERTAEALLDAAEAIVVAGGPEALSVRRVAEQASTTTRAVYSVFESKEGLLVALGNRAFEILGSWLAEMPRTEDPAADLVNAAVRTFRRWVLEHPALFRIAFQRAEIPPELAERFRPTQLKALADLVEIVSRALGLQGGLANPEVREATMKFDAMCEGLALLELRDGRPAHV
jgi:AcrR family transcriptional regulator